MCNIGLESSAWVTGDGRGATAQQQAASPAEPGSSALRLAHHPPGNRITNQAPPTTTHREALAEREDLLNGGDGDGGRLRGGRAGPRARARVQHPALGVALQGWAGWGKGG